MQRQDCGWFLEPESVCYGAGIAFRKVPCATLLPATRRVRQSNELDALDEAPIRRSVRLAPAKFSKRMSIHLLRVFAMPVTRDTDHAEFPDLLVPVKR